jgi:5'-methylthioadenosine/S-adenosylhomocysteine nucleosidase
MNKVVNNIVILAAMDAEIDPIIAQVDHLPIFKTGVGKVAAAAATAIAIWQHQPALLIFVGVAGALAPDLAQLDVVIGSDAVQWDVDITAVNGGLVGTLNNGLRFLPLDARFGALALEVAQRLGLRARMGRIASGDSFVADPAKVAWLRQTFEADAVEMEGAAVAQVAQAAGVPLVLIRVISDGAGDTAALAFLDFLPQATATAANVVAGLVQLLDPYKPDEPEEPAAHG